MLLQIVSVRDRAADAFGRPIFVHSIGQAIRSFQDEINRVGDNNDMHKHPEDYDLYHIGTFDDNNARIESFDRPIQIAIGNQLITA